MKSIQAKNLICNPLDLFLEQVDCNLSNKMLDTYSPTVFDSHTCVLFDARHMFRLQKL